MVSLTVTNNHHAAIERGGKIFPPRQTIEVDVWESRVAQIKAARYLTVLSNEKAEEDNQEMPF